MSQTRVPGALAGSMRNLAEVDLLKHRIRELEEKKDQHKEKLHRIKRNAEEWENRAKACLRQQDLLDAFDVAAKKHAAQHKEKHHELQRLRQQLASTDHDRANANKTTDCQIQALKTQLANEQQARAKTEASMQAQLKGLRDELNKEKQAHEVTQQAAKHWESLRAKDLETLKAQLAGAKKDYDSKLAEAKNRLDKKLVEINKESDTKLKTAQANWNPERTALKANVVEAEHKALEAKISLDTFASNNHNLESSLNVLGELESESQQHVVELRRRYQGAHEAHQEAQAEIRNYQKLLEEALAVRNEALEQLEASNAGVYANRDVQSPHFEEVLKDPVWERIAKDGIRFISRCLGLFL